MRKLILTTLYVLGMSVCMAAPLFSATVGDLAGTWITSSEPKLKISGIGSRSAENNGTTTLNQIGTFNLHEEDSTGTFDYTGNWGLIQEGKKMSIALNAAGQTELIRAWRLWLIEVANEFQVDIDAIEFSIESLTISQASIPKKPPIIPKKTTLKAKGWVTAWVDGEFLTKRFSYTSKVYFLYKQ